MGAEKLMRGGGRPPGQPETPPLLPLPGQPETIMGLGGGGAPPGGRSRLPEVGGEGTPDWEDLVGRCWRIDSVGCRRRGGEGAGEPALE
jgi:hypothetical protein